MLQYTNRENRYYGNQKGSEEARSEEGNQESCEEEVTDNVRQH